MKNCSVCEYKNECKNKLLFAPNQIVCIKGMDEQHINYWSKHTDHFENCGYVSSIQARIDMVIRLCESFAICPVCGNKKFHTSGCGYVVCETMIRPTTCSRMDIGRRENERLSIV